MEIIDVKLYICIILFTTLINQYFFSLFNFVQDFSLIIFLISPSHNYVTMKYHPDTIGIAVLVAVLLIYLVNNSRGYKKKKQDLLQRHRSIRQRSTHLQTSIKNHILENDSSTLPFMDDSLETGLNRLKTINFKHLSEKSYKRLKANHNRIFLFRRGQLLNKLEKEITLAENEFYRIKK